MKNYIIVPVTHRTELELAKESIGFAEDMHTDAIYFRLELLPEHEKYDANSYSNKAYLAQLPSFHYEFHSIFCNEEVSDTDLLKVCDWMIERIGPEQTK